MKKQPKQNTKKHNPLAVTTIRPEDLARVIGGTAWQEQKCKDE